MHECTDLQTGTLHCKGTLCTSIVPRWASLPAAVVASITALPAEAWVREDEATEGATCSEATEAGGDASTWLPSVSSRDTVADLQMESKMMAIRLEKRV